MIINICLEIWAVGGAERYWHRLSRKMPNHEWLFTNVVDDKADIVIYSNAHKFYEQAKVLKKPVIQRLTGPRSYSLPQPDDLAAVICSSIAGFNISRHKNKHLIYNGIDIDYIRGIATKKCDILLGCARIGTGQKVDVACEYAVKNNRHLTITGSRQHVSENVYDALRSKYPQFNWTGLIDEDSMLGYVKGCNTGIMPTETHGVSNFVIELIACGKPLINIGNVEIPPKDQIDINISAQKYENLINSII